MRSVCHVGVERAGEQSERRGLDRREARRLDARHRRVLTVWAVVVVLLGSRAICRGLIEPARGFVAQPCRIDVNRASVAELQALPGVGPGRAEAVVLERIRGGPFIGLEDLGRVQGFGAVTLGRLSAYVRF